MYVEALQVVRGEGGAVVGNVHSKGLVILDRWPYNMHRLTHYLSVHTVVTCNKENRLL